VKVKTLAVAAVVAGCVGLGAVWPGTSTANSDQQDSALEVPQLLALELTELGLPPGTGQPITTAVPIDGQLYSLDLEPHSLRAPDFQLLVDSGDGQLQPVEPEPPSTYRGTVRGFAESRVRASLIDGQLWASIRFDEEDRWKVEPLSELVGAGAPAGVHAVYRDTDALPAVDRWCGTTGDMRAPGGGGATAGTNPKIIDYGADADVEFWQKNGSSVQATMADIELIVNSMESIYEAYLNLTFEVTTIVVRTGSTGDDPYTSSDCTTLLNQFRSTWLTAPENAIRRDLAQLYTGRNLVDCLAITFPASVCDQSTHYGVLESRSPGLSLPLRVALHAHEIGHMLNAVHCDGDPDCGIMCSGLGGCSGSVESFGARSIADITAFVATLDCLSELQSPPALPFFDDFPSTVLNSTNWTYSDGGSVTTAATNEPSPPYSLNLDSGGDGEYQDNEVRSNFLDLTGLDDAGVTLTFYTQHRGVEAGKYLAVEYLADSQWNEIEAIVSDGVDQTTFTLRAHDLTGLSPSPFHPEFRLRFRTEGDSPNDDWYIDDVFIRPCPCDCEETPDGAVGVGDFLALLALWGTPGTCDCEDPPDGAVDVGDFLAMLAAWGPCP
jgi:hypothetical protein